MWPCGSARSRARKYRRCAPGVKGALSLQGFRGRPAADLGRSRIPWCACCTSPCTLKDTWQSWTSIPLIMLPEATTAAQPWRREPFLMPQAHPSLG
jgi:hypothetical protein